MLPELPEPWCSFLHDVDARLHGPVELHCLGGFVVTVLHGLPRPTADIDVLSVVPSAALCDLIELAGESSPLHREHGVYLDIVTVVTCPDGYEGRLVEFLPGTWNRLRLFALDSYVQGALATHFRIRTSPVAVREAATIEASIPGQVLSATLTLRPMGVKTVLLSPDPVVGGATVSGIVALQCAAGPGDITVALSSTKPDIAAPATATVTIPVGTNFLPFEVTTTPVTEESKSVISATANGVKRSKALVVTPGP
jgi:hypothetical protein